MVTSRKLFHTTMPLRLSRPRLDPPRSSPAGLPVPAAVDPLVEVDGRFGIIFARLDGPTMLALLANEPQWLESWPASLALHAQMHRHTCRELPARREALHARSTTPALLDHLRERACIAWTGCSWRRHLPR